VQLLDVSSAFSPDAWTSKVLRAGIATRAGLVDAAVTSTGASLTRLAPGELTRSGVEDALDAGPCDVVGFLCHGAPTAVLGSGLQPMLDSFASGSRVENRVFCLTACFAGQTLAPALFALNATAVFAYDDSLIFDEVSLPAIVRCATVADTSALAGKSVTQIAADVRAAYASAIAAAEDHQNVSLQQHLQHALDCFVSFG
jgi:hypothetical protein